MTPFDYLNTSIKSYQRVSTLHGVGLFALYNIKQGEILFPLWEGKTDWYLPSKYELNLMYENIGQGNVLGLGNLGNFENSCYWSSTEDNGNSVLSQCFDSGALTSHVKYNTLRVRAVRAF